MRTPSSLLCRRFSGQDRPARFAQPPRATASASLIPLFASLPKAAELIHGPFATSSSPRDPTAIMPPAPISATRCSQDAWPQRTFRASPGVSGPWRHSQSQCDGIGRKCRINSVEAEQSKLSALGGYVSFEMNTNRAATNTPVPATWAAERSEHSPVVLLGERSGPSWAVLSDLVRQGVLATWLVEKALTLDTCRPPWIASPERRELLRW